MLVSDKDVEDALAILADEEGAAVRAASEYMSDLSKTVLSELIMQSNETSIAAKEAWARSQPRFKEHLIKVGELSKRDYIWRRRYEAASAKLDCWRTEQSTLRASGKIG